MPYSEVYLGMQQGAIDGGESSLDLMLQDKFYEVSNYFNMTKAQYYPVILIMSKKIWETLNEEQQEIFSLAAKEATEVGTTYYKQSYEESLENLKEELEVIEPDREELKEQTKFIIDEFKEDNPNLEQYLDSILKE